MTADAPRHVLLLSGGKDSTALALYMRDKQPETEFEYVFCDTHKELPETYEYLARIEAYLGRSITRLSSGHGERGFDHYLKMYGGYLPSPQMRWCTRQLKIEPFERHVGDDPTLLYVGIRADERRSGYISTKENITAIFPFKENGITKPDVMRILQASGVGVPKYYEWRSRSGCYFCFFQQRAEWVRLKQTHPSLFAMAKAYEKKDQGYTWVHGVGLGEFEDAEQAEAILEKEQERKRRLARRRKARTLSEAFGFNESEEDDSQGCLICHL